MARQADLAQRAGKTEPMQQPERKGDEPGETGGEAFRPRAEFTISTATRAMLSAIAASTGGPGTWTKPRVAAPA